MARRAILGLVLPLLLVACAGNDSTSAPTAAPATQAPTAAPATTAPPTDVPTDAPTAAPASMVPGTVAYRIVNETASSVDVYVRTQGLVTAAPAAMAVAPGTVTTDLFPPDPGSVVVLPAGRGDPTCVSGCSFLAESSTNFGEGGHRLLVVREGGGGPELWENANAASIGKVGNALPAADPTTPVLVMEAGGVTDAKFGLKVAVDGVKGCSPDVTNDNLLLGGTNIVAYAMDPAGVKIAVHDASDADCSKLPVGGPFPIAAAAAGSRTLLLLWGTKGSIDGIAIPLS